MSLKKFLLSKEQDERLINIKNIGLALVCFYIFTSFVAVDLGISSKINSIALLFMLLWTILYVVRAWVNKEMPISGYTGWYLVFMAVAFIMMINSPSHDIFSGEFYYMMVSLCVTFSMLVFVNDKISFKLVAYTFIISGAILVFMVYAKGMLSGNADDRLGDEIMGNANSFAWMMMLSAMFGIWILVYETGKKSFQMPIFQKLRWLIKVCLAVAVLLCLYALILSGGRKYFLIPFVFCYILLVFRKDKKGKTHFWLYTAISVGVIAIVYLLIMHVKPLYDAIGVRIEGFIQGLLGIGEYDDSSYLRKVMREYAFSMWTKSPLFGYGLDSFKYYNVALTDRFFYSHCNYTELLFSGGIVLFAVYYFIFYRIGKNAIKAKNVVDNKYRSFAIGTLVCILLFDYFGVSSSAMIMQLIIALSYRVLSFKDNKPNEIVQGGKNE